MAKKFVYQKGMHGYSDFVYVDLLPQVKRARQFNVNVIVTLLVLIILMYVLVFVPYSAKLVTYEGLKAKNNDYTHELELTTEEHNGYEIDETVISFEGKIDSINELKVDLKFVIDDIISLTGNNDATVQSIYYNAETKQVVTEIITNDYVNFSILETDFLSQGWVANSEHTPYRLMGDGNTYTSEFTIGVDPDAE